MKRILILSSEFPPGPGGIGTHAYQIAHYLSCQGYEVQVVSPQDYADKKEIEDFNSEQNFSIKQLPSHRIRSLQNLKRLWTVARAIQGLEPDLVMATGARAIWLSALLLGWRKTPWVLVGHGTEFGNRGGLGAWITRTAGNRASQVICVSHYTQKSLRDFGIVKPPSLVIHNGADHTRFYPLSQKTVMDFRSAQDVESKFVLLTVGHVSDRKGQDVVIRALPKIIQQNPDVEYWMAGLPQEQSKLEELAAQLGVIEKLRFWGRVSDETLLQLYNACDLFVMTSRQLSDGDFEGYGIAVVEAALCGKPAIVSDNSGLAEAVQHGETGVLVPQDDPQKTAEAILSLAKNPEMLRQFGNQAHQYALENQTWEKVGARYVKVLEEVIAESGERLP